MDARLQLQAALTELEGAHAALREEFGLVADDLTVMVRENQVLFWSNSIGLS